MPQSRSPLMAPGLPHSLGASGPLSHASRSLLAYSRRRAALEVFCCKWWPLTALVPARQSHHSRYKSRLDSQASGASSPSLRPEGCRVTSVMAAPICSRPRWASDTPRPIRRPAAHCSQSLKETIKLTGPDPARGNETYRFKLEKRRRHFHHRVSTLDSTPLLFSCFAAGIENGFFVMSEYTRGAGWYDCSSIIAATDRPI